MWGLRGTNSLKKYICAKVIDGEGKDIVQKGMLEIDTEEMRLCLCLNRKRDRPGQDTSDVKQCTMTVVV